MGRDRCHINERELSTKEATVYLFNFLKTKAYKHLSLRSSSIILPAPLNKTPYVERKAENKQGVKGEVTGHSFCFLDPLTHKM